MKNLLKLFILITGISFAVNTNAQDALTAFNVKVDFHCPNGQKKVETGLAELDGVESIVVDFETKVVSLKYDESVINQEQIISKIEEIGYYTEFSDRSKPIKKACSHGGGEHQHEHDHD